MRGCDISHWQGSINFDKLATAAEFVIIKASEGVTYRDPMMPTYRDNARRVGMLVGYYHFARPTYGNSAESEAQYFMQTIKGGIQNGDVLVLDFEVTHRDAVNWCKQWLDYVSQNMNGCKPLVYMDQSRLNGYDWQKVVDAGYGLWIAKYDNAPDVIPPSGKWPFAAMKQYTSSASLPGISGRADANTFFGTHDQFVKYGYYRPSDNSGDNGGQPTDPCKDCKEALEASKKALSDAQKTFSESLATKDRECQETIKSYKQKLSAGVVKYIENYKEEA